MKKTHKGEYTPKNPEKYIGTKKITYRSSWELSFCLWADNTPAIVAWSSESISIPYRNPLTHKQSVYIPDFLIVIDDGKSKRRAIIIEIKPAKEVPGMEKRVSKHDKLAQVVNAAKWQAAMVFCAKRHLEFKVLTEKDLFLFKRS